MKELKKKECLLIAPLAFYSYSKYIKEGLVSAGYNVTLCNDEYPDNTMGKVMGKLGIPGLVTITRKTVEQRFLKNGRYELVLIIKGRGMGVELIRQFRERSAKVVGYNFDSFRYNRSPLKWYQELNSFFTFDYRDSEQYKIPVVPLFTSISESSAKEVKYDVSAIVRNHSDRIKYIDNVVSSGVFERKFIYIYEQNVFTFVRNFIKNPFLYSKYWKYIFFKPLKYGDYLDALKSSNFTIDYAHPSQSGITIRCFEALACQTKIITNNPFIFSYDKFGKHNTILFDGTLSRSQLQERYEAMKDGVPDAYSRTIRHFIAELVS